MSPPATEQRQRPTQPSAPPPHPLRLQRLGCDCPRLSTRILLLSTAPVLTFIDIGSTLKCLGIVVRVVGVRWGVKRGTGILLLTRNIHPFPVHCVRMLVLPYMNVRVQQVLCWQVVRPLQLRGRRLHLHLSHHQPCCCKAVLGNQPARLCPQSLLGN